MAKYSQKVMGKEVGQAKVYAPPHDMKGNSGADISSTGYVPTNESCAKTVNMSVGNINRDGYKDPKTDGIKIRGTGAATKGVMARGPMG